MNFFMVRELKIMGGGEGKHKVFTNFYLESKPQIHIKLLFIHYIPVFLLKHSLNAVFYVIYFSMQKLYTRFVQGRSY